MTKIFLTVAKRTNKQTKNDDPFNYKRWVARAQKKCDGPKNKEMNDGILSDRARTPPAKLLGYSLNKRSFNLHTLKMKRGATITRNCCPSTLLFLFFFFCYFFYASNLATRRIVPLPRICCSQMMRINGSDSLQITSFVCLSLSASIVSSTHLRIRTVWCSTLPPSQHWWLNYDASIHLFLR